MTRKASQKSKKAPAKRSFIRRWGWPIAVVVIVAGAVVGILLGTASRNRSQVDALAPSEGSATPSLAIGPHPGELAPDFTLRSLAGEPVRLSELRGQVVILDFWASWCTPCKITFPALHALWQSVADRDVLMVGVSLDRSRTDAEAYLAATGFGDIIALWESRTAAARVANQFEVEGIPHTLVIDRDGVVRFKGHPTSLTSRTLEAIIE